MTENERRNAIVYAKFNPITGEGSVGKRVKCTISDFPIHTQWLPERIMKVPLVRQLIEAGSISKFLTDYMGVEDNQDDRLKVIEQFVTNTQPRGFSVLGGNICLYQGQRRW